MGCTNPRPVIATSLKLAKSLGREPLQLLHIAAVDHPGARIDVRWGESIAALKRQLNDWVESLRVGLLIDGKSDVTLLDQRKRLGRQIEPCRPVALIRKVSGNGAAGRFGVRLT